MWIFVITMPIMIPIYLTSAIVGAPNGVLATVLSLFPFSAPVSMLLRMTSTTVPDWQIGLSLGLLGLGAAATIWLVARLFRAQTLLEGEALSVRRFIYALVG
jgi:ABC-2 type transport system permease protein